MKHIITMFLSSLFLFLTLFYYWQRDIEFQKQLEKIEMRVFIDSGSDKEAAMALIVNTEGVTGLKEIEEPDIIKNIKGRSGSEILDEVELPYVMGVYSSKREEVFLKELAARLKGIEGVMGVLYGEKAVAELWKEIREVKIILITVGLILLFFFGLSLYLFVNSLAVMKYSKVFLIHGKRFGLLRIGVILRTMAVSIIVASLSVEISYLSHRYITGSSQSSFITNQWVYCFIIIMGLIGLFIASLKRFPVSD